MDQLITGYLFEAFECEVASDDGLSARVPSGNWDEHAAQVEGSVRAYRRLIEDLARDADVDADARRVLCHVAGDLRETTRRALEMARRERAAVRFAQN